MSLLGYCGNVKSLCVSKILSLNFYTYLIVEKEQIVGLLAQAGGPHFEQLWASASSSRDSQASGLKPDVRAWISWTRELKALSKAVLAWEAAQWQQTAQLGDNSSSEKAKEGARSQTSMRGLTGSGGRLENKSQQFCVWITNGAVWLSAKLGIQGKELVE